MGEYLTLADGRGVKLGTLTDLYFVRLETLRRWVADGATADDGGPAAAYLDPSGGWRYRFPFPSEDDQEEAGELWAVGYRVNAPAALIQELGDHGRAVAQVLPHAKSHNVHFLSYETLRTDCPQDATKGARYEHGAELDITAQKQVDGRLWAIVRCPYCGHQWRLTPEHAQALAAANLPTADGETLEVLRRMMAGYGLDLPIVETDE